MGAVMFFFLLMSLIPVCSAVMELLIRLGVVKNIEDPEEWDFEDDMEETEGAVPVSLTVVECTEPKKAG